MMLRGATPACPAEWGRRPVLQATRRSGAGRDHLPDARAYKNSKSTTLGIWDYAEHFISICLFEDLSVCRLHEADILCAGQLVFRLALDSIQPLYRHQQPRAASNWRASEMQGQYSMRLLTISIGFSSPARYPF
jgi:hypothetical protein